MRCYKFGETSPKLAKHTKVRSKRLIYNMFQRDAELRKRHELKGIE